MALGKRKSNSDIMPTIKYDARVGTVYSETRVLTPKGWAPEQKDVTDILSTKGAIFDLEDGKRGWISFPKGRAPDMKLVPFGANSDPGVAPSPDHKEGVRLVVKLDGDDPRELLATSLAVWTAIDSVHTVFENQRKEHPGKVPVLRLNDVVESKTANSTSFIPVLVIDRWVPRPADLPAPAPSDPRKPVKPVRTGAPVIASMDEEGPPF
jgi:hypothetical protein